MLLLQITLHNSLLIIITSKVIHMLYIKNEFVASDDLEINAATAALMSFWF